AAVAGGLAAGVFPRERARLGRRLTGAEVLQRRAGQVADILRFSGEPLEHAVGDVVDVELPARHDRAQQHQREIDVVGGLARGPGPAAGDLAWRPDLIRELVLVRRAQRLARRGAEECAEEAALLVDLRL